MKRELFKTLPSEITFNILSRLPVRSIASSKCVCKPWLHLLSTDYFVNSHLSKPVPSLAFSRVESEASVYQAMINGAANGLLLLQPVGSCADDVVYIVNPVTREYVVVAGPDEELLSKKRSRVREHGFGASRISRQHKVVRINDKFECYVYTLETGLWRRVAVEPANASLCFLDICSSAFVGGRLYWIVWSIASPTLVACFDLETECFSSFDAPASRGELSGLKDRLCFCECEVKSDEIVLWFMKEKSWSKEHVIKKPACDKRYYRACPVKVFKNGDLLMLCGKEYLLFHYSKETKAIQEIEGIHGPEGSIFSMRKESFQIEESAVKSVTENARAQARWLAAKVQGEQFPCPSFYMYSISAVSPNEHGAISGRKEIEVTYPPINEIEEFRDSFEGVDLETGDKDMILRTY